MAGACKCQMPQSIAFCAIEWVSRLLELNSSAQQQIPPASIPLGLENANFLS